MNDDGERVTEYDPYLRHRARDLDRDGHRLLAAMLLQWQQHLWASPGRTDLRAEVAVLTEDLAGTAGAVVARRLTAHVTGYLDFCEQRDLVHALFLASDDDFTALLIRSTSRTSRRAVAQRPAPLPTDVPSDEFICGPQCRT